MTGQLNNSENDMKLYQSGDSDAFLRIYQSYSPIVYGFLRKRVPQEDVEDLFQSVWVHLHEKKHLYQDQPFAPWFFFLIRNLIVDWYRYRGSRKKTLENYQEMIQEDKGFQAIDLRDLLDTLPTESRSLIEKYYIEGQDYAELEKEMKVSQAGLRKRLSRAISSLRKNRVNNEP